MRSYINPKTKRKNVIYDCECGKKEFKKKYSELCNDCELKSLIKEGIQGQIIQEAEIQKDNLTKEQFEKYIQEEIDNSKKAITERLLLQRRQKEIDPNNDYVGSRIMGIIWNSERIKALNKFLCETDNPYPDLFKEASIFNNFKEYTEKHIIENYIDYSFLYQRMLEEKLIHPIKHLPFMEWLFNENFITEKHFNELIEKGCFRSLKKSSSINRENNYNNIFT